MGRYDNIKVYSNGWKQPSRIYIYKKNKGWVDFGDHSTSYNNTDIHVRKGKSFVRATKYRKDTKHKDPVSLDYHVGAYGLGTKQAYCFNNTGGATNKRFYAKMVVKAKGACRLFDFYAEYIDCSLYVGITSDGTVYYTLRDYQWSKTSWTHYAGKIAMGFGQGWQTIELIGEVGSNTFTVKVNGSASSFPRHTAWNYNSYGTVGDNNGNLQIKYKGVEINTYGQSFTDSYNDTYINEYTTTEWL